MNTNLQEVRLECVNTLLGMYKKANAGHIGSSLSCLEILIDLAFRRMHGNDCVILSKGHAAAALYTVLCKSKRIDEAELDSFYKEGTHFAAHPPCNGKFDAIPFGTGSLGHGLSLAAGLALSQKFTKKRSHVYCVVSEGDLNEGSTWEAMLFANHHRLSNLTMIVDANGLQGFGTSAEVLQLEPLKDKISAFQFEVVEYTNGNSFSALQSAFDKLKSVDRPKCIVAKTTKGSGVSYMAGKLEWHYLPMSDVQYSLALSEAQTALSEAKHA